MSKKVVLIEQEEEGEDSLSAVGFLQRMVNARPGGEHRPQQEEMVEAVDHAIKNQEHLLVQSGTGTGKTLGYAVPIVVSGERAIISTATKQLSEQIVNTDLPALSAAYKKETGNYLSFALVKGRHNYLCLKKIEDLKRMDGSSGADSGDLASALGEEGTDMFAARKKRVVNTDDQAGEFKAIFDWEKTTKTGDRSHGPAVSEKTWIGVSSTNTECPGKAACPFGQECFAEIARDRGRAATIVVTNHALVGADLQEGGQGNILGARSVIVVDEMHELDSYLSSAWGTQLTPKVIHDAVIAARRATAANEHSIRNDLEALDTEVEELTKILIECEDKRFADGLPADLGSSLTIVADIARRLDLKLTTKESIADGKREKSNYRIAAQRIRAISESADMLLVNNGEVVRWSARGPKQTEDDPTTLFAAPLRIGPRLMAALENGSEEEDNGGKITLIGTSATITVAGGFDIPVRNLAMEEEVIPDKKARNYKALDTGTPFNYAKQSILYVPNPDDFPSPIGKERFDHTLAVQKFAAKALKASKGRGLVLSTTTKGARELAEYLRKHLKTPVLLQGDSPAPQLVEEFKNIQNSTLVATMGMWHGLDAPGPTLSLVIIDKIPFRPMNDPLMTARQEDVIARGGNGFMDVYVAAANVMLAQGAGRLVRHTEDRGIVAILDPRLHTKSYGRAMLRSLPPMYFTSDEAQVMRSLKNL